MQDQCLKMIKKQGVPSFLELVQDATEFSLERAIMIFQVMDVISKNGKCASQ